MIQTYFLENFVFLFLVMPLPQQMRGIFEMNLTFLQILQKLGGIPPFIANRERQSTNIGYVKGTFEKKKNMARTTRTYPQNI